VLPEEEASTSLGFRLVVTESAADRGIGQVEHLPAHCFAVAAVAGVAIKALHGVIDDGAEELRGRQLLPRRSRGFAVFKAMKQVNLLMRVKIGEEFAVDRLAGLIDGGEAATVETLEVLEWSAELAVDIVDDSGPDRARILIGRNDLVNHAGQSPGFVKREELPGTAIGVAGDTGSGGGCSGKCGLQKGAAVESEARLHLVYTLGM